MLLLDSPSSTRSILVDAQAHAADVVGGKFARQARMAKSGLSVPRFFCLPTHVFNQIAAPLLPDIRRMLSGVSIADAASVRSVSESIEQLFMAVAWPAGLEAEVLAAFDAMFPKAQRVAVRASMVGRRREESEDSAEQPFAGISTSFLFQQREQVIACIRRCWASGFSPEAILYRERQKMSLTDFAVAVGVQAMIEGERSFVMFTCNPQTLTRDTVIIAGHGAGEGVVQESVPVDHFFINAQTGQVEAHVVPKAERLVLDRDKGYGLVRAAVSLPKQGAACLNDAELATLVGLGHRIEQIFGAPQDIEGTITADGQIHFLQARPVSIAYERHRVFSNANVSESFPGQTTALTYSFARGFYQALLFDYMRRCGVSARVLHDAESTLSRLLAFVEGRIYHNVTAFHAVNALHPLYRLFRKDWDRDNAELRSFYLQAPPTAESETFAQRLITLVGMGRAWVIALSHLLLLGPRFECFARDWRALIDDVRRPDRLERSPLELLAEYRQVWQRVSNWWGITLVNYQNMIFFNTQAQRLLRRWQVADDESLLSDLLCGDEQLLGVEIVLSVVRIADTVRSDPALAARFAALEPEQLWQEVLEDQHATPITKAVRTHLALYGDRGIAELKLEQPNLRDTPWELMRTIKRYAALDVTAESLFETEAAARKSGEARLARATQGHPVRRVVLQFVIGQLRRALRLRERGRYFRSELFGYAKGVFMELGRALAARGALATAADVMHLQAEEIFGYLEGTGVQQDLKALVALRRSEAERLATRCPEKEFTTGDIVQHSIPQEVRETGEHDGVFRGIGSSAGKVRGRARVVLDASLNHELPKDAILIARETDPGWLFLMLSARGIVVERGSMLSHTAITGRKFGIPTVVSVKDATTRIPDGAWIEIDGATGEVTLLDETEALGDAA